MADNLSLLLRTYMVEGENQLSQAALWPPQAHTLMQSKKKISGTAMSMRFEEDPGVQGLSFL